MAGCNTSPPFKQFFICLWVFTATRLQISFSSRNTPRNAWHRHWRSFIFETGILSLIQISSLTNAQWHSVAWISTMTTFHRSDFIPIRDLFTELDLLPIYERLQLNICDGWRMPTGKAYSSGHLVPSHLGLPYALLVETNPFPELVVIFSGLFTSNIP